MGPALLRLISSDARYKGLVIWPDRDRTDEMARRRRRDQVESAATHDGSYDDRPNHVSCWVRQHPAPRVRVVVMPLGLESNTSRDRHLCPLRLSPSLHPLAVSSTGQRPVRLRAADALTAHVDRGEQPLRHGARHDLLVAGRDQQGGACKALHLLSVAQIITEKGAVQDIDKAPAARSPRRRTGPSRSCPACASKSAKAARWRRARMRLPLEHATSEMRRPPGRTPRCRGTDEGELSGRAILTQQAGGRRRTSPSRTGCARRCRASTKSPDGGAAILDRRQVPVRVTDDLGNTKYVGINQPVTLQRRTGRNAGSSTAPR